MLNAGGCKQLKQDPQEYLGRCAPQVAGCIPHPSRAQLRYAALYTTSQQSEFSAEFSSSALVFVILDTLSASSNVGSAPVKFNNRGTRS